MEKEFTGKTVEEATKNGLAELGILMKDVETVEIIEKGKKKLFGGSIPARVKIVVSDEKVKNAVQEMVTENEENVSAPAEEIAPVEEAVSEVEKAPLPAVPAEGATDGQRAVVFLDGLMKILGVEASPVLKSEEEKVEIELQADNKNKIIGRRGEVIDAIQVLAGAVANIGRDEYKRVVVDCQNYREQREETLKHVAEKLAAKAVRLGKKVRLEPMNPYERRIIHAALVENPDVTTKSEGKEPGRFVVIIPKVIKPYEKKGGYNRDGGKKYGGKGGKGGYNRDGGKKYGERKPYPKRDMPMEDTPQSSGTSFRKDSSSGSGYKKGGFSGFFGTYLGNAREDENKDE